MARIQGSGPFLVWMILAVAVLTFAGPARAQTVIGEYSSVPNDGGAAEITFRNTIYERESDQLAGSCLGCVLTQGGGSNVGFSTSFLLLTPSDNLPNPPAPPGGYVTLPSAENLISGYQTQYFSTGPAGFLLTFTLGSTVAQCSSFTIFATVGGNNALFQCPTSAGVLYIFGSTISAVNALTCTPAVPTPPLQPPVGCPSTPSGTTAVTNFDTMTLDSWSAVYFGGYDNAPLVSYGNGQLATVPDLKTQTENDADAAVFQAGLTLSPELNSNNAATYKPIYQFSTQAAGTVLSQMPGPGYTVPQGWPVDFVLSAGPGVQVPCDLLGQNIAASSSSINYTAPAIQEVDAVQANGVYLKVTTINIVPDTTDAYGTITGVTVAASAIPNSNATGQVNASCLTVKAGAQVTLTVSGGATPGVTPLTIWKTDGTSSFNYSLYPGAGGPYVEAFVSPDDNNPTGPYSIFGNSAAGGVDASGNPFLFQMSYADATVPITCSAGCTQQMNGTGTLTIYDVNSCSTFNPLTGFKDVNLYTCDWTEGNLGTGVISAGATLADLQAGSVNLAAINFKLTLTQSYSMSTGITTVYTGATSSNFYVAGNSATYNTAFPNPALVPTPVPICSVSNPTPPGPPQFFGCLSPAALAAGEYAANQTYGPFFSSFNIDWSAAVSPTPYSPTGALVTVPNVVGKTQAAAATALQSAGLKVGIVSSASSTTVPSGQVIGQTPLAGASATPASAVNLTVSTGSPSVVVPNTVGQTQAAATTAIKGATLVLGTVITQSSMTTLPGVVLSQSPPAGSSAAGDSAVNLVVSSGSTCADLALVKAAFGAKRGTPGYNPLADVNGDGIVNIIDLSTVARALPSGTVCH